MSLVLQLRDLKMLTLISKYSVISTKQICQWFFNGVTKTTVLRRIRLLEKENFIKRGMTLPNGENSFYLSPKGRKLLNLESANPFFNRNTIEHDILLNSIRWKLESLGLAKDVTPEWEMRSEVFRNYRHRNAKEKLIPDLLMIESILEYNHAICIELELTIKSKLRYKKIFEQYGAKDAVTKIWYFCRSGADANKILAASRNSVFNFQDRLWLSVVDEFLKEDDPRLWSAKSKYWHKLSDVGFENFKKTAHPRTHGLSSLAAANVRKINTTNCANQQGNSTFLLPPSGLPSAPDYSHPTSESGQELQTEEENKKVELSDMELDKCG